MKRLAIAVYVICHILYIYVSSPFFNSFFLVLLNLYSRLFPLLSNSPLSLSLSLSLYLSLSSYFLQSYFTCMIAFVKCNCG